MENGRIKFQGSFNEFISKYKEDYTNIQSHQKENEVKEEEEKKEVEKIQRRNSRKKSFQLSDESIMKANELIKKSSNKRQKTEETREVSSKNLNENLELVNLAKLKRGRISLSVYKTYISLQGGIFIFIFLIILTIFCVFIESYRTIYITHWSRSLKDLNNTNINNNNINDNVNNNNNKNIFSKEFKEHLLNFQYYIKISLTGIFLNFFVEFLVTRITIHSLRELHETMIAKLLRAPINLFHDLVPIGQILNRLTKDITIVQRIIKDYNFFLRTCFKLIASAYICYLFNKYTIIASPLLVITSIILTNYYLSGARNLERLHRVTYSPILTILSESIRGVELIRSSNNEENLKILIYKRLDNHYGVHLYTEGTKKWYNMMLRFFSEFFFGICIIYIIYNPKLFSPQGIGLILQYSQEFTIELAMFLGFLSQIEISMISLERCEAITRIQSEKYIDVKDQPIRIDGNVNMILSYGF